MTTIKNSRRYAHTQNAFFNLHRFNRSIINNHIIIINNQAYSILTINALPNSGLEICMFCSLSDMMPTNIFLAQVFLYSLREMLRKSKCNIPAHCSYCTPIGMIAIQPL